MAKSRGMQEPDDDMKIFDYTPYYVIPRDFVRAYGWECAVLLTYFVNLSRITRARKRNKGWFYARVDRIMLELNCSAKKQWLYVRKLADQGIIEIKEGFGGKKRMMRICWNQIDSDIDCLPDLYTDEQF